MKRLLGTLCRAGVAAAAVVSLTLAGCGGGGGGGGGGDAVGDGGPAADTTPPAVVSVTPASGATDVALNAAVTVSFSEEVDCATVTTASFTLAAGPSPVSGVVACSGSAATFTPAAGLAANATHAATVTAAVKDRAGNPLAAAETWSFTTGAAPDTTPPAVVSTTPASGAVSVALDAAVTVTFSEDVDCATVTTRSFTLAAYTSPVSGSVACSGSGATFTPSGSLAPSTTHIAAVTAGVKDRAGNPLTVKIWSFVTGSAPVVTPPAVVSTSPASGATDVLTSADVTVTFSTPVDCRTLTAATFTVETAAHAPVAGAVSCGGSAATFRPSARLARATGYVATVAAEVRDLAGSALEAAQSWSFTTASTASWGLATRVDGGPGEVSAFKLAANASGAAAAVWVQADATGRRLVWWAGFDPGTGWGAPEAVSWGGDASQPQVVIDANGHSLVAWTQADKAGTGLMTRVRAAGGTWGGPVTLWGDAPSLGVDGNGNVICVWRQDDGTRTNVFGARYPLGTAPLAGFWDVALIEADSSRTAVSMPSVAVSQGGDAIAVWAFQLTSGYSVVTANRYSAASGRWGSPVDLSIPQPERPLDPTVVIDDAGEAVAIWRLELSTGTRLVTILGTARSSGASWGASEQFPSWVDGVMAGAPSVAGNARGDVAVAWALPWGTCNKVGHRRYVAGKGWTSEGLLSISSCADRPAAALDPDGNVMVAWAESPSTAGFPLEAARYTASTGSWDAAATRVGGEGVARLPALAADASGSVMAAWLRWDGTRHELLASRFE